MPSLEQSPQKSAFDIVMCIKCIFIIFVVFKFIDTFVCYIRSRRNTPAQQEEALEGSVLNEELIKEAEDNEIDILAIQRQSKKESVVNCMENGKAEIFETQILTNYHFIHIDNNNKRTLDTNKKGRVESKRGTESELIDTLFTVTNESKVNNFQTTMQFDLCQISSNSPNCHQILSF